VGAPNKQGDARQQIKQRLQLFVLQFPTANHQTQGNE
jgi:hypothetical protein